MVSLHLLSKSFGSSIVIKSIGSFWAIEFDNFVFQRQILLCVT